MGWGGGVGDELVLLILGFSFVFLLMSRYRRDAECKASVCIPITVIHYTLL